MLLERIEALKEQINALQAANEEALEALRIKYLSKKGEVTALFNEFRNVPADQKKEFGQKLNELKNLATDKLNELREGFKAQAKEANKIDITRPAMPEKLGTRHLFLSFAKKSLISSHALASHWLMVQKWKTTGTCSARSTLLPTTLLAICKTHSSSTLTRKT